MIHPYEIKYIDKDKKNSYYTIVDNIIYYNNHESLETHAVKNKKDYEIIKHSCLTHNFYPFTHKGVYYAIGGQDHWKVDRKWRGIDYEEVKVMYQEHFNKPYIRDARFYEEIKYKFDTTRILDQCRGLYLLKSNDGINWNLVQKDPIITVKNAGFISSLSWKSAEFDAKPCIVRYKDKW